MAPTLSAPVRKVPPSPPSTVIMLPNLDILVLLVGVNLVEAQGGKVPLLLLIDVKSRPARQLERPHAETPVVSCARLVAAGWRVESESRHVVDPVLMPA